MNIYSDLTKKNEVSDYLKNLINERHEIRNEFYK
jgi:hypothetical protein